MEFKNKKTAVILEGGALRSFFTCGVLDVFMENDIYFPCVCGVSAGSLTAVSYLSKQIGRTAKVNLDYVNDKRFMSMHSFIKNKMYFNFDFLFGEITHKLVPLDYDTFYKSEQEFITLTTDCITGKSVAHSNRTSDDILLACKASASMPILSKMFTVDNSEHLDGGIANPIPVQWAIDNGYEKIVVVLTRDINYRKKPLSSIIKKIQNKKYSQYPKLIETLNAQPQLYNETVEKIIELENQNRIFVIRPLEPVRVKRTEKDTKKLLELYNIGRDITQSRLDEMLKYLEV